MRPAAATRPYALIVEDEAPLVELIRYNLVKEGYEIATATDGEEALLLIEERQPDIVLLDWMLPKLAGIEVARRLRSKAQTRNLPIIMLTARTEESDRIRGLDIGADDYLGKPFDLGELQARIRALMRRGPALRDPILRIADLVIDTHRHVVRRGGRSIELTNKEYSLLEYLALRQGAVVGRAEISEHVWDEKYDPTSNLIEVYVQRLRRKIDEASSPRLLHTRRGEGYQLALLENQRA
jgi:DNA-binding response OmpR family regulator